MIILSANGISFGRNAVSGYLRGCNKWGLSLSQFQESCIQSEKLLIFGISDSLPQVKIC